MTLQEPKNKLLDQYKVQLKKALVHLEYSYEKAQKISLLPSELTEEELETWESFSARFSRVVDIFTSKFIRLKVEIEYPGFSGSLRDYLNKAEALGLIDQAQTWAAFKDLRNMIAHEYADESLTFYFKTLLKFTPHLFEVKKWI